MDSSPTEVPVLVSPAPTAIIPTHNSMDSQGSGLVVGRLSGGGNIALGSSVGETVEIDINDAFSVGQEEEDDTVADLKESGNKKYQQQAQHQKQQHQENGDSFLEIKVSDPQKIGEGMGSYVCYKVSTRTNLTNFRTTKFSVNRRFSDFLGLREKLTEKHIHSGIIVPPPPEKDAVNNAKIIMSKDETSGSSDFLERRAASLTRFVNRIASHPVLKSDHDFREFLELESDLPKAKSTSALSGAGVRRLFNRMGDTVSKITFRMDETDPVSLTLTTIKIDNNQPAKNTPHRQQLVFLTHLSFIC